MPLRFDATLKDIAQDDPAAFVSAFDAPPTGPVAMLNVDLSAVTAATDLVFGVGKPLKKVVHIDCQSRAQKDLGASILRYNALLFHRLRKPVHSLALLLHPRAEHADVNGVLSYGEPGGQTSLDFRYGVVRLWQRPAEELLQSPPSLLPLATLGRLPPEVKANEAIIAVVNRILTRLNNEVDSGRLRRLAAAAYILAGMKVEPEIAKSLFLGVHHMQDSSTFQAIIDEGMVKGVQKTLLRMGRKRFGKPDNSTRKAVLAITKFGQLERLSEQLLDAKSWEELLGKV